MSQTTLQSLLLPHYRNYQYIQYFEPMKHKKGKGTSITFTIIGSLSTYYITRDNTKPENYKSKMALLQMDESEDIIKYAELIALIRSPQEKCFIEHY